MNARRTIIINPEVTYISAKFKMPVNLKNGPKLKLIKSITRRLLNSLPMIILFIPPVRIRENAITFAVVIFFEKIIYIRITKRKTAGRTVRSIKPEVSERFSPMDRNAPVFSEYWIFSDPKK
jgi:hypothetical protein